MLKANSTPNIAQFTCATPMLDTPDVYIDGKNIVMMYTAHPQNKQGKR